MNRKIIKQTLGFICMAVLLCFPTGCTNRKAAGTENAEKVTSYVSEVLPLERNGTALYLDYTKTEGTPSDKNILLVHGVTYSSHEFDIDYKDYSLVRRLAREGYTVWKLDIAGFGRSGEVDDGFMPDSDYAAEDIAAAVNLITQETGQDKIDVLGWSWGTVTTSRFAAAQPAHVNKLVLYAPILSGIGNNKVEEAFHHNTWEHAADDFQRTDEGELDYDIADPVIIEMYCSSCWHYDGEFSPNGGRRDISVSEEETVIDLTQITVPTLIICGSEDPYLNYDLVNTAPRSLPAGSALEMIEGGSHVVMLEEPYYHDFQDRLIRFLSN